MKPRASIEVFHTNLSPDQKTEDDFFASPNSVCSVAELYKPVFWKMRSLWLLDEIIKKYQLSFAGKVLELGGGYGIHAAFLKARYGDAIELYYSDVSAQAVKRSERFEDFFGVSLDHKWVIEAEAIPAPDASFDVVFFFAAFHHLQNHERALAECRRVLRPGGQLYLLLEPSCPRYLKKWYDQKTGHRMIHEKHFTTREYYHLLTEAHFNQVTRHYFSGYFNRESRQSLIYYFFVSLLPEALRRFVPCSQVIVVRK